MFNMYESIKKITIGETEVKPVELGRHRASFKYFSTILILGNPLGLVTSAAFPPPSVWQRYQHCHSITKHGKGWQNWACITSISYTTLYARVEGGGM